MELNEFDILFKAIAIKCQALADFATEFANVPDVDEVMEPIEPPHGTYLCVGRLEIQVRELEWSS